jgi:hypothetical protein
MERTSDLHGKPAPLSASRYITIKNLVNYNSHVFIKRGEDIFASDQLVTNRVQEIGEKGVNKFFIRRHKETMHDWHNKVS